MLHIPISIRLAVAMLAAVAVAGLAGCSGDNDISGMPGMDHGSHSASAAPPATAGPFDTADIMFAQMMIPHHALKNAKGTDAARLYLTGMIAHHQGAITMAEQEVANGQNPEANQLAQRIIDTQQAEISTMRQLLEQF